MILVAVEDLMFLSKIQETARAVGVAIETGGPENIGERAMRGAVSAVIIDLNHRSGAAVETVRALKSNPSTRHIPITGFLSHVQAELATAARGAGCDSVMARLAFTQQLPQLLLRLAGADPESEPHP